eukprot:m.14286 g.14286  ORF g.14286 m.14286 type:complete len:57 (-) comp6190_c0_seq1:727-897(-)
MSVFSASVFAYIMRTVAHTCTHSCSQHIHSLDVTCVVDTIQITCQSMTSAFKMLKI